MSADELRKAADRLHDDDALADLDAIVPGLTGALADWLDDEAELSERHHTRLVRQYGINRADDFLPDIPGGARDVARRINGGA